MTLSTSRAIDEEMTFTIPKVSIPSCLAFLTQAKVSAVSPYCEMKITRVFLS